MRPYPAKKAAILTQLSAIEPTLPRDRDLQLAAKSQLLLQESTKLHASLKPELARELGRLVRTMNCYYSNLIEDHPTHPVDIDRALSGSFADNTEQRNLQLEAVAHIHVQSLIDAGKAPSPAMSVQFITWLHRTFCELLPEDLLWVENPDTGKRSKVVPGELRQEHERVGRHLAPSPTVLPMLLDHLVAAYATDRINPVFRCTAAASAHHRLLWIHPFLDGNGRVARLLSDAMLREWSIGCQLWSVSRGLARNIERYKAALAAADEPRRGDLDGRGNLTEAGLHDFCDFFLDVCLDQVAFMRAVLKPEDLDTRIRLWCEEEMAAGRLPRGSWDILRHALLAGSFARGEAAELTGYQERQARTVLGKLLDRGVLVSDGPRAKVRIGFPVDILERWLPSLYPAASPSVLRG